MPYPWLILFRKRIKGRMGKIKEIPEGIPKTNSYLLSLFQHNRQ